MQSASLIDLSSLDPGMAERILWLLEDDAREKEKSAKWWTLLDSGTDADILDAARSEYCQDSQPPIVLAETYPSKDIQTYQECVRGMDGAFYRHNRRPVIMRGAKECNIIRYSGQSWYGVKTGSPNGWALAVLTRAIRMSKVTAFDDDEIAETRDAIVQALRKRYPCLTYHFDKGIPRISWHGREGDGVYIGGRQVYLSDSEFANVKALHNIIKKTDKLDQRLSLARQHMQERMKA